MDLTRKIYPQILFVSILTPAAGSEVPFFARDRIQVLYIGIMAHGCWPGFVASLRWS
jgi:hypothetical protein